MKNLATNKSVFHNYSVIEKMEVGIVLNGAEVKSCVGGQISLKESYVKILQTEAYLWNAHINKYRYSSTEFDENRTRKLLLHKRQVLKLNEDTKKKGLTIIPISMYISDRGKIKLEIGLCKGKKLFDKREDIKGKELDREILRRKKDANKYTN